MSTKSTNLLLILTYYLASFIILSCSSNSNNSLLESSSAWTEINGRSTIPIYKIKVPSSWQCHHSNELALSDTTQPLCTFYIPNENPASFPIVITIHNFPAEEINQRIPTQAQINRWKGQFSYLDPLSIHIQPQAFNGFTGLLFEAYGTFEHFKALNLPTLNIDIPSFSNNPIMILGWALQIGSSHFRTLSLPKNADEANRFRQMRSDVTIKVIGTKDLIEKYKDSIIAFARSLELLHPI